jgi:hypothetical protein
MTMHTYSITLANGRELIVVADSDSMALTYAQRTTMTRPLVAKLVR